MTVARNKIFIPKESNYYHCIVRCVRRSYLCGYDRITGRDFEHRRQWIKNRLSHLLQVFAIDCFSYAVMSNHLHTVIKNNPQIARSWSNQEIAVRWRKLFPKYKEKQAYEEDINRISQNSILVEKYRERLSCISWFNRCMNENIAKRANKEDECKGRFWESRFYCQRLESTNAVVACGIYVDLNPLRAKMADTPENSDYTSIQERIKNLKLAERNEKILNEIKITPRLVSINKSEGFLLTEEEYINLVDATGRIIKNGKRGMIDSDLKPILERLNIKPDYFIEHAFKNGNSISKMFTHVIGNFDQLKSFAQTLGQKFVHGINSAKIIFTAS